MDAVRQKYELPEKFIFHLGNTDPKKNTPNVIRAYDIYLRSSRDPLPLVMIDLGEAFFDNLISSVGNPSLKDHLFVTGYIKNTDLPAIYSLSSLFLYPSLRESFGIPILEAMSCGSPVITSNTSSMPEIASDAAYLVNPQDINEIAHAISHLSENAEMIESFKEKGFKRAEFFSWHRMATEMLSLYTKILQP
jgi:glycosyltransferase involved in cell wall biosynthesis